MLLNGGDGNFYAVEHGETRGTPIDGLPGLSDLRNINYETCEALFRHFKLQLYVSRDGGGMTAAKEVDKVDCTPNKTDCLVFMGMKEIKYKMVPDQFKVIRMDG